MCGDLDKDICNKACAEIKKQISQLLEFIRDIYYPLNTEKFPDDERRPHLTAALKNMRKSVIFRGYETCSDVVEDYCELMKNHSYGVHPVVQEVMKSFSSCEEFADKLCESTVCAEKLREFTDTYKVPQVIEVQASSTHDFSNHGLSNNTGINEQFLLKTKIEISEDCEVPDQKAKDYLDEKLSASTNEYEKQSSSTYKLSNIFSFVNTENNKEKLPLKTPIKPEFLNEKMKEFAAKLAKLDEEKSSNLFKDCSEIESTALTEVRTKIPTESSVSSQKVLKSLWKLIMKQN